MGDLVRSQLVKAKAALNEIAWMDEFLSADCAREMMKIARDTLSSLIDEQRNSK